MLSHLFGQGTISAELMLTSHEFRAGALTMVREALLVRRPLLNAQEKAALEMLVTAAPRPHQARIVYAIATHWNGSALATVLPFFSKINLRAHASALIRQGYQVQYAEIEKPLKADSSAPVPRRPKRRPKSADPSEVKSDT